MVQIRRNTSQAFQFDHITFACTTKSCVKPHGQRSGLSSHMQSSRHERSMVKNITLKSVSWSLDKHSKVYSLWHLRPQRKYMITIPRSWSDPSQVSWDPSSWYRSIKSFQNTVWNLIFPDPWLHFRHRCHCKKSQIYLLFINLVAFWTQLLVAKFNLFSWRTGADNSIDKFAICRRNRAERYFLKYLIKFNILFTIFKI